MKYVVKSNFDHSGCLCVRGQLYAGPDTELLLSKGLIEIYYGPDLEQESDQDNEIEVYEKKKRGRPKKIQE